MIGWINLSTKTPAGLLAIHDPEWFSKKNIYSFHPVFVNENNEFLFIVITYLWKKKNTIKEILEKKMLSQANITLKERNTF
jgi:hypothetical protein